MTTKTTKSALRTILLGAILLLVSAAAFASSELPYEQISKEKAAEDLAHYFELIDQQHGNPYQYISRAAFKSLVDNKIESLPESISNHDFSSILLELNQNLRCGHTSIKPDGNLIRKTLRQTIFFPYPVSIIDQKIYLDFDDGLIPHASRIDRINGIDADKILKDLLNLTITDGFIETKKKREVESKFGYYFFMKYGAHPTFEVDYTSQGKASSSTINGIQGNKMLANNYYRPVFKSHERYNQFTHLDAVDSLHSLVLTFNTFKANPEWFYERISSRYNKATKQFDFENLVLDLRGNEGGDRRLLNILYQIIAGKELYDPSETYVRSKQILGREYLLSVNGRFNSDEEISRAESYLNKHFINPAEDKFTSDLKNWYDEFKFNFEGEIRPFEGQVYVLTSGKTFSAAADLARILGQLNNVTLIGEETGGAHEGRTANMLLSYALPHSKLKVQVPVIYEKFVNADHDKNIGRGTFPDYYITQSVEDLANKRDAVFDFTIDLIQQNITLGSN